MEEKTLLNEVELEKIAGGGSGTVPAEGVVSTSNNNVYQGNYYTNQLVSLTSGTIKVAYAYYVCTREDRVDSRVENMTIDSGSWSTSPTSEYAPSEYWDFHAAYPYVLNVHPE